MGRPQRALALGLLTCATTTLWSPLWWRPVGARVVLFEAPCCALDATAAEFSNEYGLPPDSVGAVLERAGEECASEPSHHRVAITVNMPVEPDVVRSAERGVTVNLEGGDAPQERVTTLQVNGTKRNRRETKGVGEGKERERRGMGRDAKEREQPRAQRERRGLFEDEKEPCSGAEQSRAGQGRATFTTTFTHHHSAPLRHHRPYCRRHSMASSARPNLNQPQPT